MQRNTYTYYLSPEGNYDEIGQTENTIDNFCEGCPGMVIYDQNHKILLGKIIEAQKDPITKSVNLVMNWDILMEN
jgi:hypothetical protein